MNNIYNTFIDEIEKLKKDKNVKSIIHVGSSKDKIDNNMLSSNIQVNLFDEENKIWYPFDIFKGINLESNKSN